MFLPSTRMGPKATTVASSWDATSVSALMEMIRTRVPLSGGGHPIGVQSRRVVLMITTSPLLLEGGERSWADPRRPLGEVTKPYLRLQGQATRARARRF